MDDHEYQDAIMREVRAHRLAEIRLQRLEAERQAVLDMAMQRSMGIAHQPTTSLYYVEPPVSRPVLEDSWWAAPVRPRSYDTWQQPPLHQLPPEPYLVRTTVVPPAAPLRTWTPAEDPSIESRKSSFSVPLADRKSIGSKAKSSDQQSFPESSKSMPSPTYVPKRGRPRLNHTAKHQKIAPKVAAAHVQVMDSTDKPKKKRGRPLGSKNAVVVPPTLPGPPPKRQDWNSWGLGNTRGTPAYNAHQRALHRASGQPLPEELIPLDFARKIYAARVRKVPLPDQSPLQIFFEKTTKVPESQATLATNEPVQHAVPLVSANEDKKKRAKKSFDGQSEGHHHGDSIRDTKLDKKEIKKKKKEGKNSNGSTAVVTSDAMTGQDDHAKQQSTTEPLRVLTPFPHALHRLYHMIQQQDMEDCSADMHKSHDWPIDDVKTKIKGFEEEIAELDKREQQIVKESKQLNATDLAILGEAYQLLGVMPPDGC